MKRTQQCLDLSAARVGGECDLAICVKADLVLILKGEDSKEKEWKE